MMIGFDLSRVPRETLERLLEYSLAHDQVIDRYIAKLHADHEAEIRIYKVQIESLECAKNRISAESATLRERYEKERARKREAWRKRSLRGSRA